MVDYPQRIPTGIYAGEGLDSEGIPNREGVYLAVGIYGSREPAEIDVYRHPVKGLSVYSEDFGLGTAEVDDATDCHCSVQIVGPCFVQWVREL